MTLPDQNSEQALPTHLAPGKDLPIPYPTLGPTLHLQPNPTLAPLPIAAEASVQPTPPILTRSCTRAIDRSVHFAPTTLGHDTSPDATPADNAAANNQTTRPSRTTTRPSRFSDGAYVSTIPPSHSFVHISEDAANPSKLSAINRKVASSRLDLQLMAANNLVNRTTKLTLGHPTPPTEPSSSKST